MTSDWTIDAMLDDAKGRCVIDLESQEWILLYLRPGCLFSYSIFLLEITLANIASSLRPILCPTSSKGYRPLYLPIHF
jgi:hypothetical protein